MLHWFNRNIFTGSRRNIEAHYDIGNELFELMLDGSMMYSSAIYSDQHSTLEQAAVNKLDRICQKLHLTAQDHLLEIGTDWGGMAIHAAKHYGCHVTTLFWFDTLQLILLNILFPTLTALLGYVFATSKNINTSGSDQA